MNGKICMITGANAGIGKVTALELAKKGAVVVMVCRSQQRGEAAQQEIKAKSGNPEVDLLIADLSSLDAVRQLGHDFRNKYQQLHVLINNAGAVNFRRKLSVDGLEMTFALNHLSYFLLTNLLLDTLKQSQSARIINVASAAHYRGTVDFENLQRQRGYRPMEAYGQSKLANILFTYELARRLEGTGITANCLHPGFVASNFGKNNGVLGRIAMNLVKPFALTPEKGAATSVYLASSAEVNGVNGKYFVEERETRSSAESYDSEVARKLWDTSEMLTGLSA